MKKSQFKGSAKTIDLNGQSFTTTVSDGGVWGFAFPKLKANKITLVARTFTYGTTTSSRASLTTSVGGVVTKGSWYISAYKEQYRNETTTIQDGRIMDNVRLWQNSTQVREFTITFDDVEMVDD